MTRRPIPFSGSAFFFGLAPAPGRTRAPCALMQRLRGKGHPLRQRFAGQREAREPAPKGREAPGTTPSPLRSAPRSPAPRALPALPQPLPPLKAAPFSAPYCRGAPRRGSAMCPARPDSDSTHLRADRGGSSVRLGFSPRSGSESCPLPLIVPHSASALFPSPGPGPADKKAPECSGAKHEEGKSKGRLGEGSA